MKRLAVFVEGKTEALFVERLLVEIAGAKNIRIEQRQILGGAKSPRQVLVVKAMIEEPSQNFYALIFDCGGDGQVKTRIHEEHARLTSTGYSVIIGLRDVRPIALSDLGKLEIGLRTGVKTSLAPVKFILSIMEIEAWFLAEVEHFSKIDSRITLESVKSVLGLDPSTDSLESVPQPADDLHRCYQVGGKAYSKKNSDRTIAVLDYTSVYIDLARRVPYLRQLIAELDGFLATA